MRPKKENKYKKNSVVYIRLTEEEHAHLKRLSKKSNLSLSAFCAHILLKSADKIFDKEALKHYSQTVKLMTLIGGNINQITKAMNAMVKDGKSLNFTAQQKESLATISEFLRLWERSKGQLLKV